MAMNSNIIKKCLVPGCPKVRDKDRDVSFHAFPKENETRSKWRLFCGVPKGKLITHLHRVCSLHFEKECFEGCYMKDYGLKTRTRLRLDAIPTLIKGVPEGTPCGERAGKRARKKLVQELLQSSEEEEEAIPEPAPPCCESAAQLGKLKSKISELEQENTRLRMEARTAQGISEDKFLEDVKQLLKGVLSPTQIDLALGVKKRVNWTEEDLSKAFGIRFVFLSS
jgi:hypothetical protein